MAPDVCALVGGQFGSEGKGAVVAHIAREYKHHVRVGAANAGHTIYDGDGRKHVMQQLPCAAYVDPDASLYVGPGALISPEILYNEIADLQGWRLVRGLRHAIVWIDARAHVITTRQIASEQASDLAARIGSTSATAHEGIGAAQADRVMRAASCVTADRYFGEHQEEYPGVVICDAPVRYFGEDVLLEGTQGTSLSITTGVHPYTTSRNTTAAGLCADAGVAPSAVKRVVLVIRTYPIRVAGNSGPFWMDSEEIKWEDINVDPESERTTVTKKVRRVATFSMEQLHEACVLNMPTEIALMFCDYMSPWLRDQREAVLHPKHDRELMYLIESIESHTGVPVTMLGTGPNSIVERESEIVEV